MLLLLPTSSFATTLYFDEFGTSSPVSVDGLQVFGVTFNFTSGSADYNGQIGTSGFTVLVSDPLLTGPTTGTLTLAFDTPTPLLQFDLALNSADTFDSAYTVTLFSGDVFSSSTTPQPLGVYSEGEFLYTGAPISGATITFFNGTDSLGGNVAAFGLDNLTTPSKPPEPATAFLLRRRITGSGLCSDDARSSADSAAPGRLSGSRHASIRFAWPLRAIPDFVVSFDTFPT